MDQDRPQSPTIAPNFVFGIDTTGPQPPQIPPSHNNDQAQPTQTAQLLVTPPSEPSIPPKEQTPNILTWVADPITWNPTEHSHGPPHVLMSTTPPRETAPTPQDPHAEQISKQTPTTTFLVKTDDDPPHSHSHPQSHALPMNSLRSPPTEQDTCSPNGKITVGAAEGYPPGGPDCQGSHSPGKPCCGLGGPRIGEAMMSTSEAKLAEPIPGAGEESTYLEKTSDELDLQPEGRTQHLQTDGQQNPSSSPVMPDTPTPIYESKGAPAPPHTERKEYITIQQQVLVTAAPIRSQLRERTRTRPHGPTTHAKPEGITAKRIDPFSANASGWGHKEQHP